MLRTTGLKAGFDLLTAWPHMPPRKGLVLTLYFALISLHYGDRVMLIDALIVDRYEIKNFKL